MMSAEIPHEGKGTAVKKPDAGAGVPYGSPLLPYYLERMGVLPKRAANAPVEAEEAARQEALLGAFIETLKEHAQDLSIRSGDVTADMSIAECSFDSLNRWSVIGVLASKLPGGESFPESVAQEVADAISDGEFHGWTVKGTAKEIGKVVSKHTKGKQ